MDSRNVMMMTAEIVELWTRTMGRGEVELNALRVFYTIAAAGGRPVPQTTIRDMTGLAESSTSRNISLLSTGATPSQPGPKLVESYPDPDYQRRKLVRLTAKGKQLLQTIEGIVQTHSNGG